MDGFIHTDDHVSLRYTERGAGRPVVFVHGWQGAAEQWRSAAQVLAGECRTVTYDQRGHGRSHDAPCGWTVHRLAHDLAQLLERLALTDAVLVGHSMGCSVIWAYLELFGAARLERLVLVDQAPAMLVDPVWHSACSSRSVKIAPARPIVRSSHTGSTSIAGAWSTRTRRSRRAAPNSSR